MGPQRAVAVLDYEVSQPFPDFDGLEPYGRADILCRLHGRPLGFISVPVVAAHVRRQDVVRELLERHAWALAVARAETMLCDPESPVEGRLEPLTAAPPAAVSGPLVTVAVCTRDRAADLRRCLHALQQLDYPDLDLVVIDNAPSSEATRQLVETEFPGIRYVREGRPGLDWARNRAILECRGEILAFTDDDVVVDARWVSSLVRVFAGDPSVMAITGLVVPYELDTDAQRWFERYGGFGRGVMRRWYRAPQDTPIAPHHAGAGKFGTGANMAFRREVFDDIGGFDPALDVGTCTNGGGDLEMFFRVLKHGHTLVYEPAAIVRHRHRRTYEELRVQIRNNGIGFYSYLRRSASAYPDERWALVRFGLWWFGWWSLRRLFRKLLHREALPLDLIVVELLGSLRGPFRYRRAATRAAEIQKAHPHEPTCAVDPVMRPRRRLAAETVRVIDIAKPLTGIADAAAFERVRVVVSLGDVPLGAVTVEHYGAEISALWLGDQIAQHLAAEVLDARHQVGRTVLWAQLVTEASERLGLRAPAATPVGERAHLEDTVAVSVVVATYDRPADLRRCLESLVAQRTARPVEIVVVDNHPASGVTRPIVAEFAGVTLVEETRGGLSYARNRGIAAASGDLIATTDDDVVCPPEWLEHLLAPFTDPAVHVVTGNVLAAALDSTAAQLFEAYGGLGRGYIPKRVDHEWFAGGRRAVPTWELGCTANAAFRAGVFRDPAIGLMDEALGAGTPTGCSEDTYVFYRALKAGHVLVYEPRAVVWHHHRSSMAGLRKQIYSYSKGHVAYHLTTWLRDGDLRGLRRVIYELPVTHARRVYHRARGWSTYPMKLLALEVLGNLAGPLALWRSRRRVRRLGGSAPLNPPPPPVRASRVDLPAV